MQTDTPTNALAILQTMIDKGTDAAALEKMMDLADRWKKGQAEEEFNRAMNACQQEMPTVVKDKENTEIRKRYAPVETVQTYAKPVYIKHGFSLSFGTEVGSEPGLTHCYVDVQHVGGFTKRFYLHNVPLDDKGPKGGAVKTQVQGLMSSLSYAQGRLVRLAFNITVADEDRDGRIGRVSAEQIEALNIAIDEVKNAGKKFDYGRFMTWLGVESVEDMNQTKYEQARRFIEQKMQSAN
jgi:hypothetical protein